MLDEKTFKALLGLLIKILVIAIIFLSLFGFLYGVASWRGASMEPSIKDGDLFFFYRREKNFLPGDAIALKTSEGITIRRVTAMAGDLVDVDFYGLRINGALQQGSEIYARSNTENDFPILIPNGYLFVTADSDGSIFELIEKKEILGKIISIIRFRGV